MTDPTAATTGSSPAAPRIDADDDADVHAWAAKLDASAEQVRDAIKAVGAVAGDVEMHLKGSRSTTNSERVEGDS